MAKDQLHSGHKQVTLCKVEQPRANKLHVKNVKHVHKALPKWVKILSIYFMSRFTRHLLHSKKWYQNLIF